VTTIHWQAGERPIGDSVTTRNTSEVCVLLSCFRGQDFISSQAESIAQQTGVGIQVVFHMDEECSSTESLVRLWLPNAQRQVPPVGLGLPQAFFALVAAASDTAAYYAFSDQDDVWEPNKLARAVAALCEEGDQPTLWVCRIAPFRHKTGEFLPVHPRRIPHPSFGNALVETIAPGCAMVWNRALQEILLKGLPVEDALMHDSWTYLVASAFGRVMVEPEPLVHYRVHDNNTVGIRNDVRSRTRRFKQLFASDAGPTLATQASAFVNAYGPRMTPRQLNTAMAVAESRRFSLALGWLRGELVRQNRLENLLLLTRLLLAPRTRDGSSPRDDSQD